MGGFGPDVPQPPVEGSVSKGLCWGWDGSAMIIPAGFRVQEGRQIAVNHLLRRTNDTLPLSLAVAVAEQMVVEDV